MTTIRLGDDSGVNILLEYLFTLIVMVMLFSIMVLTINNVMDISDRIVLKEEFDIISNDVANRISAFSSEIYLNNKMNMNSTTLVDNQRAYFELPELVRGKQYKVDVTYDNSLRYGKVVVSYASNSNIYSSTTFTTMLPVSNTSFYSQQNRYDLYYDRMNNKIEIGEFT